MHDDYGIKSHLRQWWSRYINIQISVSSREPYVVIAGPLGGTCVDPYTTFTRKAIEMSCSTVKLCQVLPWRCYERFCEWQSAFNPFTASCENAMTLSLPGVPGSCEKFPHSSRLNFWSTESIFNQFSVFLKTLNALCVCLQYKHPRSMKRVIRSDKPVTLLLLLWSHKCDFGAEPRSHIIATSAVKGLKIFNYVLE
jgi:hypothetical protein